MTQEADNHRNTIEMLSKDAEGQEALKQQINDLHYRLQQEDSNRRVEFQREMNAKQQQLNHLQQAKSRVEKELEVRVEAERDRKRVR